MKSKPVSVINHKKAFAVKTYKGVDDLPFARLDPKPSRDDPIDRVDVDHEMGNEVLQLMCWTREGKGWCTSIMAPDDNQDLSYMRDLLLIEPTAELENERPRAAAASVNLIAGWGRRRVSLTASDK